jgi:voltage-gated potassium channel Kch
MAQFRLLDRLRYRLDATLSRGPGGLIAWLFVIGGLLALLSAAIITVSNTAPAAPSGVRPGFLLLFWQGWQRTLNLIVGVGPIPYIIGTFIPTLGSLFIGGIFIGLLTGGIQNRIRNLRKGRSVVMEKGHVVILGWSPQIFQLITELALANANKSDACIVVMGEKDKVDMEDVIREKVGSLGKTRIVCRTGSPIDLIDLELVNPDDAKAIVILAPDVKDPDSQVIKTMLAISRRQGTSKITCPIVAEIRSPRNRYVAEMVGNDRVKVLLVDEMIARITVQTCRQVGLSAVYAELLGFDGDELYLQHEPKLVGKTFAECLSAYEDSCVVGLQQGKTSRFNPPMDTVLGPEDSVIALSQDDDTVVLAKRSAPPVDAAAIRTAPEEERTPERTLIIGWNRRAPLIIKELDQYVIEGSMLTVAADMPEGATPIEKQLPQMKNQTLVVHRGDTGDRSFLETLDAHTYHHVITLGYSDRLGPQEADAITLVTLLHLRDLAGRHGNPYSIVSEMFDPRNRELAEVARADDFIVGDKLVSQLLAQLAENPLLALEDLFDADGSELYIKPAEHYISLDTPISFYTVVEAAKRRGEVALGYRLLSELGQKTFGMHLNPKKSEQVTFSAKDKIIVLAQS